MKKILFVIDRLNEGAGRVVYDLVKNLDDFRIVIVSLYNKGNLVDKFEDLGVKIIHLNKKPGKGLETILRLSRIIKKEKADVVHTHNVDAYEYGVLAAWLAGVKVIHTAHGKSVKRSKLKRIRERLFHKFVSLFLDDYIAVSRDLGGYAAKNWCLRTVKTIYNGIDVDKYKKRRVNKNFLYKLGAGKKDLIIGIVAGLRPVKNHASLIKAMGIIKREVPNSKLLVVGDGFEKEKLVRFVENLGLEKDILFLGNRTDVIELYNCFDVGVLCSFSECLSITLLEGMSCGVPFVATRVGGNPELIEDNVNGFLVPAGNSNILAERIIELLKDKRLSKQIRERAVKKVIDEFSVDKMVLNYKRFYS